MAGRTFCNVENRAFPDSEFVSGPRGTTVHVMEWAGSGEERHPSHGHSLDGWTANWREESKGLTYEALVLLDAAEADAARIV